MYIMIQDKDTNFVYISNKLSLWKNYSTFCNELMSVMDELKIPYGKIYDAKDVWARDFMPIQLEEKYFFKIQPKNMGCFLLKNAKNYSFFYTESYCI